MLRFTTFCCVNSDYTESNKFNVNTATECKIWWVCVCVNRNMNSKKSLNKNTHTLGQNIKMDKAGNLNLFTEIICIHRKKRKTKKKIELGTIFAGATYFLPLGSLPIQISNSHSHITACSKKMSESVAIFDSRSMALDRYKQWLFC